MSLLNAALAFGAFAFSIPLVIHLLFRSRYTTLDWGAMYLLESVVRVNRRRMQLTQILLLLLRCLIPILLAFCLARPVWQNLVGFAGDSPRTLVIAIDDSRSLSRTPAGKPSLLQEVKQELTAVIESLTRRDEVMLVRASRLGAAVSKMGASQALTQIRRLEAECGPVSMASLLDAAWKASGEGTHARRQILLVSDFQDNSLQPGDLDELRRVAESNRVADRGTDVFVDFLLMDSDWSEVANVSVDEVSLQSPVLVKARPGVFSTVIRNGSDTPNSDLRLTWAIDGKPLDPRLITIAPKSTRTIRLTHTFDRVGVHEVSLSIGRADDLTADNQRSIAVEVIPQVDVLLVEGSPGSKPLQGQADFLAIALSPFAFGGDDRPDPVRARVVSQRRLAEVMAEVEPRVIVLAGVGRLAEGLRERLAAWLQQGGNLVVFDGPRVDSKLYNEPWPLAGDRENRLRFPAKLGALTPSPDQADQATAKRLTIDSPTPQYVPWRILAAEGENPFADVSISTFRQLTLREAAENAFVLLATTDGEPLGVRGTFGEGTVVQFAISATTDWTNFPLRPAFLP
ncbi:MAG: BatA domain-containing protein, partial [Planctomycetota bacterium]